MAGEGAASAASGAVSASSTLSGPAVPENTAEEARFAEAWRKAIAEQGLSEQISITARGRSVVMQIQDKILFASGHDEIENGGLDVIRRLAPLLTHSVGDIRVEGHTDNVPINNERFASNWSFRPVVPQPSSMLSSMRGFRLVACAPRVSPIPGPRS